MLNPLAGSGITAIAIKNIRTLAEPHQVQQFLHLLF